MVELNTQSVLLGPGETRSKQWQTKINSCLNHGIAPGSSGSYQLVKTGYLVGVMLCVFATKAVSKNLREVALSNAGVGYGGFMGNKGGVAVRFCVYDSTFCFVCAHLAAHRDKVKERNNDFANLSRKIVFEVVHNATGATKSAPTDASGSSDLQGGTLDAAGSRRSYQGASGQGQYVSIPGHDILVWLGDFNYRIDTMVPIESVHKYCDAKNIQWLLVRDQLNIERKAGRAFRGFEEGPIKFLPTYKYQPKTNLYERRPDKKKRAPAWCDRVLWQAVHKNYVSLRAYNRAELVCSDHKPVFACFTMQAKTVVESKKNKILERITYDLDKWENEQMPRVELSSQQLNFGDVYYEKRIVRKLVVTNVGKNIATFRFAPKLEEKQFCKPWLSISPKFGMLKPGSKLEVHVAAHVDSTTARGFATKKDTVEDIIILRLENGRDFYVTISGRYMPSCFGMELAALTNRPDPILLAMPEAKNHIRLQVPKEMWRLCDVLFSSHLLGTEGIFTKEGLPAEMKDLRLALDTGTDFSKCSPHSVAAVLLEFLRSLHAPILSPALFDSADDIEAARVAKWSDDMLARLQPLEYNVFLYVLLFFKEALKETAENGLSADMLVKILGPCFAWKEREHLVDPRKAQRYRKNVDIFLKFLIVQDYF